MELFRHIMKNYLICSAMLLAACGPGSKQRQKTQQGDSTVASISRPENFGADVAFLQTHVETIVLKDSTSKAAIAVVPAWQGRVMTSTAEGDDGRSLGWLNHSLIADGKIQPHINAYGGEDRFWLGPEGSQNSFYFAPGDTFNLSRWQVPAPIDTEPFNVVQKSKASVSFEKDMQLTNYKGHVFHIRARRTITLIARRDIRNYLGVDLHKSVHAVAFHSANTIINSGKQKWDTASGMPSIWILGMFPASAKNMVVVPLRNGSNVNDAYFGKVPAERLAVENKVAFFKADANHRSKIGVPQADCYNYLGSYDAEHKVLTIVQFTLPRSPQRYVNAVWGVQPNPFGGDVLNAYNDGPPAGNQPQLGRFFELESSSPAAGLKPGGALEHYHRTIHLQGEEKRLGPIVEKLFGVTLAEIRKRV
ncbi:hypothetical protein EGT74_20320 [Chitinophaga lutea]|uniref:Uncharacterized protein n=1 Tax=Chitinophaga lutea TaxID=2488634 RepID=A0A3N4QC59_9BACT|nr:DUF6786 family protein [Chitinophaga lutea]RPE09344.1 hypothetical protein EGT74_20320 [Chitinophaga lutea]